MITAHLRSCASGKCQVLLMAEGQVGEHNNKQHEGADNLPPAESHILAPGACRFIVLDVASLNA